MPKCSAFTPYGQLRYSGKPSQLESIYRSAISATSDVYATDGGFEADIYASAREIARASATLERVANHRDPHKACELLPELEHDYGLTPSATATDTQRRDALADRMMLRFGARRDAVVSGLTDIVGSDGLVEYRTFDVGEITPSPADPNPSPGSDMYLPDGSQIAIWTSDTVISVDIGAVQTMQMYWTAGTTALPVVGQKLIVEAGRLGLEERVVVVSSVATVDGYGNPIVEISAVFNVAHGSGVVVRSGTWPRWTSAKRLNIVVLSDAAFANAVLLRRVHEYLGRVLRGVSTWLVTVEDSPGYIGPFEPGTGLPGITHITEVAI